MTEKDFALTPISMGARIYLPQIGRFAQVDPVEGGTENNYVYPTDPVNEFDLSGRFSIRGFVKDYFSVDKARFAWGAASGAYSKLRGGSFRSGYDRGIKAADIVGSIATLGAGGASAARFAASGATKIAPYSKFTGINSKLFGWGGSVKRIGTVNKGFFNQNNWLRVGWNKNQYNQLVFRVSRGPGGNYEKWYHLPHKHLYEKVWP
jgi:hypothetical protein